MLPPCADSRLRSRCSFIDFSVLEQVGEVRGNRKGLASRTLPLSRHCEQPAGVYPCPGRLCACQRLCPAPGHSSNHGAQPVHPGHGAAECGHAAEGSHQSAHQGLSRPQRGSAARRWNWAWSTNSPPATTSSAAPASGAGCCSSTTSAS